MAEVGHVLEKPVGTIGAATVGTQDGRGVISEPFPCSFGRVIDTALPEKDEASLPVQAVIVDELSAASRKLTAGSNRQRNVYATSFPPSSNSMGESVDDSCKDESRGDNSEDGQGGDGPETQDKLSARGEDSPSVNNFSHVGCRDALEQLRVEHAQIGDGVGAACVHCRSIDSLLPHSTAQGHTLLELALPRGHQELVPCLSGRGACPSKRTSCSRCSELHRDASFPDPKLLRTSLEDAVLLSLSRGAEPSRACTCGCLLVHDTSVADATWLTREPYPRGTSFVNNMVGHCGYFPLHRAASANDASTIAALVDHCGAVLDAQTTYGVTAVHVAAYACSLEALKALLERGALMMVRDDRGLTAVHYGCQSGCVEVVELLLRRGGKKAIRATVEGRYLHETTPMHIAAASGHIQMMELLHREAEWLKTARDEDGCTPLHIAAAAGHLKAVSLLLRWMVGLGHKLLGLSDYSSTSYRRRARELNARTRRGVTPLMLAVGSWDPATLALLLDDFANMGQRRCRRNTSNPVESSADRPLLDPGLRNAAGADVRRVAEQGEMSLHQAAGQKEQEGSLMVMELLLRAGASVQDVDNDGWSPLHIAAARGSEAFIGILISAGAQPESVDKDGWSPLHLAAEKGRHEAVQALADAGAPLDAISHEHGLTALHQACAFGHVKACEVLIKAGALMQVRDARAQSPLHIAAANGHAGVIDTLLKHAPRDLTSHLIATGNILGFTPLHLACENGHEMATKILLARGAPPDTTCKALYTPSHQAAMSGSVPTLRAVVAGSKGSMIARAKGGWTPAHLAAQNGHIEVLLELWNLFGEPAAAVAMSARTDCGVTPLHQAAGWGHADVVELLLGHFKVPPDPRDADGETPLHVASQQGYPDCIDALCRAGGRLGASSRLLGNPTPLHNACSYLRPSCVYRLLWWGGDARQPNAVGVSPRQLVWFAVDDVFAELDGGTDVSALGWSSIEGTRSEEGNGDVSEDEEIWGIGQADLHNSGNNISRGGPQGAPRNAGPIEVADEIETLLLRADSIAMEGKRDRTWGRRRQLILLRELRDKKGILPAFLMTQQQQDHISSTTRRASGTSTLLKRLVEFGEIGIFRHVVTYV